jgi:hypothetical protein
MSNAPTAFAETDPEEVQFSQWIVRLFDRTEEIAAALEPLIDPEEGSPLCADDARSPHYPVSAYAFGSYP